MPFRSKLQAKLASYRDWSAGREFSGCRLVHYCGVDLIGAQDLLLADVVLRIEGLLCEGFYVDWAEYQGRLFLRVWEFDGPEPDWHKVFAEQSLGDIDESRRGFEG
jgi:hypothetical protein